MNKKKFEKIFSHRAVRKVSILVVAGIIVGRLISGCVSTSGVYTDRKQDETSHRIAVVCQDREEIYRIDLDVEEKTREIQLPGVNVVLQVEKGRIRYLHSDCPDKICINTGWLSETGHMAACLPNRSIVFIENGQ